MQFECSEQENNNENISFVTIFGKGIILAFHSLISIVDVQVLQEI